MNSSERRTELFEFWPLTVLYASPLKSDSRPAPIRMAAFSSSRTFQFTNFSMSGCSASRITIFAARRVVPPDLVAPAARSRISRKDMRPEEVPPPERRSPSARSVEKLVPVPEPNLKSRISRCTAPAMSIRSSWIDWMKQAESCGCV